jgi:hypothetical protein
MRCIHHGFPFKVVPKQVTTESAKFGGTNLNRFPAKGGISANYSPYTILTGQAIDFKKHLAIPFGSYVQANNKNDPSNTNAPRTLDCIYLGLVMDNRQGGHKLLHLGTGKVITRPQVKKIPMSDTIIRAVENMARCQGVKQLKFTHRDGTQFEPANYIAGVEDDSNNEEDKDYKYKSESDNSSGDSSVESDSDSENDFNSDDEGPPELVRRMGEVMTQAASAVRVSPHPRTKMMMISSTPLIGLIGMKFMTSSWSPRVMRGMREHPIQSAVQPKMKLSRKKQQKSMMKTLLKQQEWLSAIPIARVPTRTEDLLKNARNPPGMTQQKVSPR